jgi:5-methylcytosine-specific restriction endonuclease McrA
MAPVDFVPAHLPDRDLLAEVARVAASEREATSALVALLAEVDARRLHLAEGCSSLFTYCTDRLHLSEQAAYHRIHAARAVRRFPTILSCLRDGSVTLSAVTLLAPHLTVENHERLLAAARHRSTRDVELLVRSLAPLPDVRASVRRLPTATGTVTTSALTTAVSPDAKPAVAARNRSAAPGLDLTGSQEDDAEEIPSPAMPLGGLDQVQDAAQDWAPSAPSLAPRPSTVSVLSPGRYSLRVTLSAEGHTSLRRAQDLLRHSVPNGDPAVIVERALALLVARLERQKFAATRKRAVEEGARGVASRRRTPPQRRVDDAEREGRAASSGAPAARGPMPEEGPATADTARPNCMTHKKGTGRTIPAAVKRAVWQRDEGRCTFTGFGGRCRETGGLEFHHCLPVGDGGPATVENLRLMCRSHHAHESERWFGEPPRRAAVCDVPPRSSAPS